MTARKTKKAEAKPVQGYSRSSVAFAVWGAVVVLGGFVVGAKEAAQYYADSPEQTTQAVLTERYNAQQAAEQLQAVDVVAMVCRELKGDDRAFKDDDRLQVQCDADIPGVFFWDFRNEAGEWQTVYYNERPTFSTGYLFANAPEEIRVQFRAINGNTAEYYLTLPPTDVRPAA